MAYNYMVHLNYKDIVMSNTATWLDRVKVEYLELSRRLEALNKYLTSTPPEEQPQRELLVVQAAIMDAYKTVLEARVLQADKEGDI